MGVQKSFVRSTALDSWTDAQLKMMSLGGNRKLKEYFKSYDLDEESILTRLGTNAAVFYREGLKCWAEEKELRNPAPTYDEGR